MIINTGNRCERCGQNEYIFRTTHFVKLMGNEEPTTYDSDELKNEINENNLCASCQAQINKMNYDKRFYDNKQLNNDNHYDN